MTGLLQFSVRGMLHKNTVCMHGPRCETHIQFTPPVDTSQLDGGVRRIGRCELAMSERSLHTGSYGADCAPTHQQHTPTFVRSFVVLSSVWTRHLELYELRPPPSQSHLASLAASATAVQPVRLVAWHSGRTSVSGRGELSLSCARPAADGWPL